MLKELLQAVQEGGYVSKPALAEKFDQPVSLIEAGLSELIRMDYLRESEDLKSCELPCGKCPYASFCNQIPLKTIIVTEKGKHLLNKPS